MKLSRRFLGRLCLPVCPCSVQVGLWSKDQERKESIPLFCCYIHDETLMRMRSFTPLSVDRLVRGRSSKIQTHVVTLRQTDFLQEFFSELIPLACKDTDTICQSFIDVIIEIYQSISCASSDNWEQLRFIHLLTSDSVSANLAAAKRLWASLGPLKRKNGLRVRYSLLFWFCSSHQANLVTQKKMLHGRTASATWKNCGILLLCAFSMFVRPLIRAISY